MSAAHSLCASRGRPASAVLCMAAPAAQQLLQPASNPPSTGGCASRLRPADKAHALSQQIGRTTRPAGATGVPGEGTARHADLNLGGLAPANHNTSQRSTFFERVDDRNDGRKGNHFNRRSTSGIQEIVQDTPRRPQRRQPRHGGAAYEVRSGSQATTRCMHRREKTAASRMDVRSAAGLGRGSHRSSHTPAPPLEEAQARREIPPSPPQVGLSRTASAGGSPVGEEVQGFPAPVWILLKTRYYGSMVYVCLASNTRGKLRSRRRTAAASS